MRGIDRNVVLLGWVSFFTDMASAMVNPLLPIFVVSVLHAGMDKLGVIVALATFVSYALRIVSGYLSDRYGVVKPLVAAGYALSAVAKPLVGTAQGWQGVAAFRAMERLGKGLRSAPKDLLLSTYGTTRTHGRVFGFHKTMDIAGELAGTLLLFGVLAYFGTSEAVIRGIFYATALPGAVGVFIVLFFVRDAEKRSAPVRFTLSRRDRRALMAAVPYFLFLFFMFGDAFFTMQAKAVGIATAVVPLLFVVSTGAQTLTSYLLGRGVDRFGAGRVLRWGYLFGTGAMALLWLRHPAATWVAYALLGLFTVATLNAQRAAIAREADNRGSVYGIFYAGIATFAALGAWVGGWIWQAYGISAALVFAFGGTTLLTAGSFAAEIWKGYR